MINIGWDKVLCSEYEKEYFQKLILNTNLEYEKKIIYPEQSNVFAAMKKTDYDDVRVVILGQDPYHGENEANGLSFSVNKGIKIPPSLRNIFKELDSDLQIKRIDTDLKDWAEQGVLLLNSILIVEKDKPLTYQKFGWEIFTDSVISILNERTGPVIFVLWGNFARSKKDLITNKRHYIIESVHPSPLSASRGFLGSKPFSQVNNILIKENKKIIRW